MSNTRTIIKNGFVVGVGKRDIAIEGQRVVQSAELIEPAADDKVIDAEGLVVAPAFVDVHVHLREPGYGYKERIATGTMAAARGGYSTVCSMPNLNPVPDSLENLRVQLDAIKKDAKINIIPFGSITKGEKGNELSDLEEMAPFVCGFSDDGVGVNDRGLMKEAMQRARALDKVISAHCEDASQIKDSPEAEWKQIERDVKLADETKVKYHVCHISTKESVSIIFNQYALLCVHFQWTVLSFFHSVRF